MFWPVVRSILTSMLATFCGVSNGRFGGPTAAFPETRKIPREYIDAQFDGQKCVKLLEKRDIVRVPVSVKQSKPRRRERTSSSGRDPPGVDRSIFRKANIIGFYWNKNVFKVDAAARVEEIQTILLFVFGESFE